jgi:hypothetical protein
MHAALSPWIKKHLQKDELEVEGTHICFLLISASVGQDSYFATLHLQEKDIGQECCYTY